MAHFNTLEVEGFIPALYGMRHPLKSYDKSDSGYFGVTGESCIGPNDYDLAKRLCQAGSPEHAKFLRQIMVWVDVTLPRFVWSEWDTYKIGTVANSQSTMHRLIKDGISSEEIEFPWFADSATDQDMTNTINTINRLIDRYKEEEDKTVKEQLFFAIKALLPEGYVQTRLVTLSYATLKNMYNQRKNHRLPQWNTDFVSWVHTLPYSEFITDEWPEE